MAWLFSTTRASGISDYRGGSHCYLSVYSSLYIYDATLTFSSETRDHVQDSALQMGQCLILSLPGHAITDTSLIDIVNIIQEEKGKEATVMACVYYLDICSSRFRPGKYVSRRRAKRYSFQAVRSFHSTHYPLIEVNRDFAQTCFIRCCWTLVCYFQVRRSYWRLRIVIES